MLLAVYLFRVIMSLMLLRYLCTHDCQLIGARHLVKTGRGIPSPFVEVEFIGCEYDNDNKYKTSSAGTWLSVLTA